MCLHGDGRSVERRLFCLHTVPDQCVEIQATASIFSPALFPIWCTIGGIILQLSSHGAAVNGDAALCTGRSTAFVLRVHAGPLGAEERWTHLCACVCVCAAVMFQSGLI